MRPVTESECEEAFVSGKWSTKAEFTMASFLEEVSMMTVLPTEPL